MRDYGCSLCGEEEEEHCGCDECSCDRCQAAPVRVGVCDDPDCHDGDCFYCKLKEPEVDDDDCYHDEGDSCPNCEGGSI